MLTRNELAGIEARIKATDSQYYSNQQTQTERDRKLLYEAVMDLQYSMEDFWDALTLVDAYFSDSKKKS